MLKLVVCSVFNDTVFCLPVSVTPKKVKALLHCEMFRATCLAMFWRHCGGYVTYPATAKIVARQVARAIAESRIRFYFSCNLSRNDFGRCRVCYTVKGRESNSLFFLIKATVLWRLKALLHCQMFRATCPATMSPKHCETSCTKHFTV